MVDKHKGSRVGTRCQKFDFSSALVHCRSVFRVIELHEALYSYIRCNIDIDITIPRHQVRIKSINSDLLTLTQCLHIRPVKVSYFKKADIVSTDEYWHFEITKYLSIKHMKFFFH